MSISGSKYVGYLRLSTDFNGLLYKPAPTAAKFHLQHWFSMGSQTKGEIVLSIATHAANDGWDIVS